MERQPRRVRTRLRLGVLVAGLMMSAGAGAAERTPRPADQVRAPFPVDECLSYGVSWAGIHCGRMDILSFVEPRADGVAVYRIVAFARTTRLFDGIYRVRTRLDSFFDPVRMTSIRYEEHSLEKKRRKHEVWAFDADGGEVTRTKNGEVTRIQVGAERAYDPLAFIYRLRETAGAVGGETVLSLMTSKGAVETVARTVEADNLRTKLGRCHALAVVPEPRDRMLFSKSGAMVVWISSEEPRRPCRIEFDLSFGKLVANLVAVEEIDGPEALLAWTDWEGAEVAE